jgi:hypothetical protein
MNLVPDADAVTELLRITRDLLTDERSRGQSLDAKTSTLAGFTGTILAVTAALGKDVLELDRGSSTQVVIRVLFVISVAALAGSALLSVAGVLRPQPRLAISGSEIERFGEFPLIAGPKIEIEGSMINTTIEALLHERALNDRKGRLTRGAALALAIGFSGVGLQAVVLGISGA